MKKHLVKAQAGLGQGVDTYLVGSVGTNNTLVSQTISNTTVGQAVKSVGIDAAMRGFTGRKLFNQDRSFEDIVAEPNIIWISTTQPSPNQIQIAIADNGSGIPEHIRSYLFDPFFTTKPVGKGTGLGLSISDRVVTQKHGGKLWCESTQGTGTKFVIELPISRS